MTQTTEERAAELAEAHWGYVSDLLNAHDLPARDIETIGFHYRSAFIHGYKHAVEDAMEAASDV